MWGGIQILNEDATIRNKIICKLETENKALKEK